MMYREDSLETMNNTMDVKEWNPYSRLKTSEFKNMHILRNWASSYINATLLAKKFKPFSLSPRRGSVAFSSTVEKVVEKVRRNSVSTIKTTKKERSGSILMQNKEKVKQLSMQNRERRKSIALKNKEETEGRDNKAISDKHLHKLQHLQVQKLELDAIETNENYKNPSRWF